MRPDSNYLSVSKAERYSRIVDEVIQALDSEPFHKVGGYETR